MSIVLRLACLACLTGSQGEGEPEPSTATQEPVAQASLDQAQSEAALSPPPDAPQESASVPAAAWSWAEIEAELSFLQERYPGWCRLESLGRSLTGRDIPVLVISDLERRAAEEKPALFFFDAGGPEGGGAETTLEFARRLLALGTEEPMATVLRETTVYVAPALDPDLREPWIDGSRSAFHLNFPVGWLPEALRPGSGDFPLSRPETLATVRFLQQHPNLVLVLGIAEAPPEGPLRPWSGAQLPAGDRELFRLLEIESPVRIVGWDAIGTQGGGLFDYAYQAGGVFTFALVLEERARSDAQGIWRAEAAQAALELLQELPRLALQDAQLQRHGPDLWTLDVRLTNLGTLPTQSALGAVRGASNGLRFRLAGGTVLWTARRAGDQALFGMAEGVEGVGSLPQERLLGHETRWMRFVFNAQAGGEVELSGGSTWTGITRLSLFLRE